MKHYISKLKESRVAKNFLALAGSNLALRPVQLLKEFMVARYLGPSDYGLLKSIELITMMNKYGSLGYKAVAAREAGDALGRKDQDTANRLKGYSYAGELILMGVLFIAGLTSSVFFNDYRISILIIFASFSFIASKLSGLFQNEVVIKKNFYVLARVDFISGLIASLLVILLVPYYKIYVVILMQFFVGTATIIYFYSLLGYRLTFEFNFREIIRVSKIGIPITINTLLLGIFKYGERILILTYIGKTSLGFYSLALAMADQVYALFKIMMRIRAQDIFENLGRGKYKSTHLLVVRETRLLLGIIFLIYPFYYFGIDLLIPIILPEWVNTILYAKLLYLLVPIQTTTMYLTLVLSSSTVNQQKMIPIARFFSVISLLGIVSLAKALGELSLYTFSLIVITSSATFTIGIIYFYKRTFFDEFIATT